MKNTFRTAAVGGFNRQDVMEYITRTAAETAETVSRLEQERDEYAAAAAEKEALADELTALREQLEHVSAELARERSDRERLSGVDEEKASLERKVAELEEQSAEYQKLKSHITQVELEARQRADELIAQAESQRSAMLKQAESQASEMLNRAEEEAASVRRALSAQVQTISGEYAQLLKDFDVVKNHVTSELRKVEVSFTQLPLAFNKVSAELKQLEQKTADN